MPDQLKAKIILYVHLHILCSLWLKKKTRLFSAVDVIMYLQEPFLDVTRECWFGVLCNPTGMVILYVFHSCWRLFALNKIQLDAYCAVVFMRNGRFGKSCEKVSGKLDKSKNNILSLFQTGVSISVYPLFYTHTHTHTHTHTYIYIYIYIYIYCHPQTDCFVLSELFSVARHVSVGCH